jgi:hypothetical protein
MVQVILRVFLLKKRLFEMEEFLPYEEPEERDKR